MANYKLTIQYVGTKYNGWQRQGNTENTIQGKLEAILERLFTIPVEVIGSGRTDAGAHAFGQVANFHVPVEMDPEEILEYLNRYLPKDIAVSRVERVPDRFHSRFNVKRKTYQYRIWNSCISNVFEKNFVYELAEPLNTDRMKEAALYWIGEHDFKAFCSNKRLKKSTVRTIYEINIEELEPEIRITITGNGFLYNMVRIMVGTLIEIGMGEKLPSDVPAMLAGKDRRNAGFTAPSSGLMLMEVEY
ncbi:MAG: tRNA pseudouridine(38-40) synthase TruA [Lachnospiraceae bacterium]|jgi:tRNA pseudouridine38-40 synthase|nr:tRNA pseudouridine(38-40) synthase TruA [Lachnospiraceae bacterium]